MFRVKAAKKYCLLLFCLFLSDSPFSYADTIFLKNGQRIEQVETWEENGMIKCRRFGAVVGYPVNAIIEVKKETISAPSSPALPQRSKKKQVKTDSASSPGSKPPPPPTDSNGEKFKLTKLYDGDSFKTTDRNLEIYVRIIGIDAPETAKPAKGDPGQPYAEEAKDFVQDMLGDAAFRIKGYGTDRYKRQLAQVFIGKKDLGLELIRAGLAECYRGRTSKGFDPTAYKEAEKEAKRRRIGIWSQGSRYISPREWRKKHQ